MIMEIYIFIHIRHLVSPLILRKKNCQVSFLYFLIMNVTIEF